MSSNLSIYICFDFEGNFKVKKMNFNEKVWWDSEIESGERN